MASFDFPKEKPVHPLDAPSSTMQRAYAIGDVHGRYDLFRQLAGRIASDQSDRASMLTGILLLGNIVDFGPDSVKMVRGCMNMTAQTDRFVVLKGNHEDMMGEALRGDLAVYSNWLHFGGKRTLLDWGVSPEIANGAATIENLSIAAKIVGLDVIDWLVHLPLVHRFDDYLFVHAGIRPGIDFEKQDPDDLLWIRKEFLESDVSHGVIVVHGHSAERDGLTIRRNRIGIDTDAHRTGRLTALGLDTGGVWSLNTVSQDEAPYPAALACSLRDAPTGGSINAVRGAFGDEQLDADLRKILAPFEWKAPAAPDPIMDLNSDAASVPLVVSPMAADLNTVAAPAIRSREGTGGRVAVRSRAGDRRSHPFANWKTAGILTAVVGGAAVGIAALGVENAPTMQRPIRPSATALVNSANANARPVMAFSVRAPVVAVATIHRHQETASERSQHGLRPSWRDDQMVQPMKNQVHPNEGQNRLVSAPVDRSAAATIATTAMLPETAVGPSAHAPVSGGETAALEVSASPDASYTSLDLKQARRDSIHAMRSLRRQ
uniref:metallophosphoesterase n=1 Tax=uncultured Sphingomonas sp. TaxID=158754 RepID=UPI0035C9E472